MTKKINLCKFRFISARLVPKAIEYNTVLIYCQKNLYSLSLLPSFSSSLTDNVAFYYAWISLINFIDKMKETKKLHMMNIIDFVIKLSKVIIKFFLTA